MTTPVPLLYSPHNLFGYIKAGIEERRRGENCFATPGRRRGEKTLSSAGRPGGGAGHPHRECPALSGKDGGPGVLSLLQRTMPK